VKDNTGVGGVAGILVWLILLGIVVIIWNVLGVAVGILAFVGLAAIMFFPTRYKFPAFIGIIVLAIAWIVLEAIA
jgi:hypothetical protein